jgi:hypothetical protein
MNANTRDPSAVIVAASSSLAMGPSNEVKKCQHARSHTYLRSFGYSKFRDKYI